MRRFAGSTAAFVRAGLCAALFGAASVAQEPTPQSPSLSPPQSPPEAPPEAPPQMPPGAAQAPASIQTTAPVPAAAEAPKWSFDLSAFAIDPPDGDPYASAILRADHDWLHLEGRWNYEAFHTGSLFVGRNFEWKLKEVELAVVPMAGLVVGNIDAGAPGLEIDVKWKWLELYSESEYVIGFHGREDDFLYVWSELTIAPLAWLRAGIVAQRTHAFHTERSVDRGLLLSLSHGPVSGTVYWFDPDQSESYWMFAIGFSI